MAISDRRPRQKILQEGDFDFLLADHSLQFHDFLLLPLQLVGVAEGLGAVFFQLRLPTGESHWMNDVGSGDLRVGPIGLGRFAYDWKLKFGTVGALTHGAYRFNSRFTENEASRVSTSVLVGSPVQLFVFTSWMGHRSQPCESTQTSLKDSSQLIRALFYSDPTVF